MAFFISANMRKCMNEGRGDPVPIFLHDIPLLFERKIVPVDVSIISVRSYIITFMYTSHTCN